jgi:HEAT repeat protein
VTDWTEVVNDVIASSSFGHVRPPRVEGSLDRGSAIEHLLNFLEDENYARRVQSARALAKIGAPAVPGLIARTHGGLWYTRESAVRALGSIDDPRAVEPVVRALAEANIGIQRVALEGAVQFASGSLAKYVGRALALMDERDRELVLDRLGESDERLRSYLVQLINSEKKNPTPAPVADAPAEEEPEPALACVPGEQEETVGRVLERFRVRWRRSAGGGRK